jgi:hypothetical protein
VRRLACFADVPSATRLVVHVYACAATRRELHLIEQLKATAEGLGEPCACRLCVRGVRGSSTILLRAGSSNCARAALRMTPPPVVRENNNRQLLESLRRENRARGEESEGDRANRQEPREAQHGDYRSGAACYSSSAPGVTVTEQKTRAEVCDSKVCHQRNSPRPQTRVTCFRAALTRAATLRAQEKDGRSFV